MKRHFKAGLGVMFLSVVSTASMGIGADTFSSPTLATTTEKATPPAVAFSGGLLSVTAKHADIPALIESISVKSGVEIVLDKSITGKVTIDFKEVKFEEGLKKILSGVVEGGFSSEYVKKNNESGQLSLSKVQIVRIGKEALKAKDAISITDVTVQDAVGKEVVYAKWGDGKDEIQPKSTEILGKTYRNGFANFRVDDQGNLYLLSWAHQKVFIYDAEGRQRKSVDFNFEGSGFDVDHEGNIYIFDPNRFGSRNTGKVLVYNSDGKLLDAVTISPQHALFTPQAVIEDGVMRDPTQAGTVYDFRRLLKNPEIHSGRKKIVPYATFSYEMNRGAAEDVSDGLVYIGRGRPGSQVTPVRLRFPSNWQDGRDGFAPLALRGDRFYLLNSVASDSSLPFYSDYAIGVINLAKGQVAYYRIAEKDTYVYEYGNLSGNYHRFDVDEAGNVYYLFTSHTGVHVYKYDMGGVQ